MCPYAIMVGEKYTYLISYYFKFNENDKIEEGTLLSATNNNLDSFLHHLGKCGVYSFQKLKRSQIHSFWPLDDEDDENVETELDILVEEGEDLIVTSFCNGTIEVVKNFQGKFAISCERDSVYAFRQCDHQCVCEEYYPF